MPPRKRTRRSPSVSTAAALRRDEEDALAGPRPGTSMVWRMVASSRMNSSSSFNQIASPFSVSASALRRWAGPFLNQTEIAYADRMSIPARAGSLSTMAVSSTATRRRCPPGQYAAPARQLGQSVKPAAVRLRRGGPTPAGVRCNKARQVIIKVLSAEASPSYRHKARPPPVCQEFSGGWASPVVLVSTPPVFSMFTGCTAVLFPA